MNATLLKSIIAVMIFFAGCGTTNSDKKQIAGANIYVLNEGNIGQANASITSYNIETGEVIQNVYETANGVPVGDALHSATLINGKLYLVVNNSHKIEVVDPETLVNVGTISLAGQPSPRYIAQVNEEKAYVTNLYTASVSVLDLKNFEETGSISVGQNPEGIAVIGQKAFVANSGFGSGNTLSVINTQTDEVTETITIGNNPISLQADAQGRLWVVCVGAYDDFSTPDVDESTPGEVYVLDGHSGAVISKIEVGGHPGELVVDSELGKAWLSNGSIFQINTHTFEIENKQFINRSFYALGLARADGEAQLWAADAGNFSQNGMAYAFDATGAVVDSFVTGIIPGHFYFHDR